MTPPTALSPVEAAVLAAADLVAAGHIGAILTVVLPDLSVVNVCVDPVTRPRPAAPRP